jgi:hypothetical protein
MNCTSSVSIPSLIFGLLVLAGTFGVGGVALGEERPLNFSGGHELGRNDYGRPINLIAAGLGVKPEQFREAFSKVTPAKGRGPSREEQRKNKETMMKVLRPLGITNERLDEVANYYRFRPQAGELWPVASAKGYANIEDGKVKKLVITETGGGYNTPPRVTIEGMEGVRLEATLGFDKDLKKNGAIASVRVAVEGAER